MPAARRSATSSATCRALSRTSPTWSLRPRRRAGRRRRARLVHRGAASRSSRTAAALGRRRGRAATVDGPGRSLDLGAARPRARGRPDSAARPASRPACSARARGPAAPARPHAAALPAVVRVLHARRLAGHARRRALRHAVHAHRRPRRVAAGGHARPGSSESRRLPGLGRRARRPDRLFLGSEGTLGVITEAWMRLQDRPALAAPAAVALRRLRRGGRGDARRSPSRGCTRRTAGCSTRPRRCSTPASTTAAALLVLGFESADHPVDAWLAAPSRSAATTAATCPTPRAVGAGRRREPARRRRRCWRVVVPAHALPARRARPARR